MLTITRYDDINVEDVNGARRRKVGLYWRNPERSVKTKGGHLYGRYVSGRRDAAPQQRVGGVLRPGILAGCALMRMKIQRG